MVMKGKKNMNQNAISRKIGVDVWKYPNTTNFLNRNRIYIS